MSTISEVAVLQVRTPEHPEEFRSEFPGLEAVFPNPVRVYWLFPEMASRPRIAPFSWRHLTIHPVPFPRVDARVRSGNWEWLQDPFLVVPEDRPRFVIPAQATVQDQLIVTALARAAGAYVRMAGTYFEGGNLFWMGQHILAGRDTLLHNPALLAEGDLFSTQRRIEADFRPAVIHWIGDHLTQTRSPWQPCGEADSFQPFFHLDLYVMPAGRNLQGNARVAVADLPADLTDADGVAAQALVTRLRQQLARTEEQVRASAGPETEVIRVPMVLRCHASQPRVFSPCNGLYESTPAGDRILLPDYVTHAPVRYWRPRLKAQKRQIEALWEARGASVHWVTGNYFEDSDKCGALHCRIKIIQRVSTS
ncbi:MAG: hypothetical protein AAGN35_10665 [Bacteroidota bacterium]